MLFVICEFFEETEKMSSVLDISIAFEDQEDADVNLVDCSRELAIASYGNFNELRLAGKMAHKVVLAATVPYFMKMFTSEMVEARSNAVHLNTIDAEIMETILNFVYTGRVKFTSANMERLLKAADYLQLSVLSSRCSDMLKAQITEQNVFSIRKFAMLYNAPQAVIGTDCFIQRFFESVSKSEEFVQLDFQTLVQILNWDHLHVDSEECVFEALIRWLEYDAPSRHVFAPNLLATVRMPFLRPAFIIDEVSKHPLFHSSMECRDLIDEAKNFHLVPERQSQFSTRFKTTVRICTDMPGRIYAMGGINQLQQSPSAVEYYDPSTKKWSLGKIGIAVFDRKIYVVGGYNGTERLKCAEMFDTRTNQWDTLSPMLKRRSAMCAITLGEHLFVCGGYDGNHALDSVESFDVRKKQWFARPPMLASRCAAASAVAKGLIYVIGGHNGVSIFNTVERFDPISQRWERVAPMQQPRCRLAATTFQDKIYAVGGYYNGEFVSTAEVYDPDTNQWVYIAPMSVSRARVSLVTNGDLLYAVGGYDGENNLSSVEVYHPTQNRWEKSAPMRIHEGGVGCVVVPLLPRSLNKLKRPITEHSVRERPLEKRGDGSYSEPLGLEVAADVAMANSSSSHQE
uniref:BTB domain-containing protein n=1 Tax=Globodera rostochiensis TaxID=31243 RepID=A0A914GR14_GLORO